jgi:glutathione S-transferase
MSKLKLHLLPPSPNNTKVLIALKYKNIDFDAVLINHADPTNRDAIIADTGQSLTPAIHHNGTKLFDSSAILRYLDVNFPGPRLYAEERETHKEIEAWEAYHRNQLGPLLGGAFGMFFSGETDEPRVAEINQGLNEATQKLEDALEGKQWLVGDSMTAADICVACFLHYSCFNDEDAQQSKVWQWMKQRFELGPNRENARAHIRRVMDHLPQFSSLGWTF